MKKIIVTGASGLVGSHLIAELGNKYEIHALSRRAQQESGNKVIWHLADLEKDFNYSSLPNDVEALVYLAQSDYFRDFPEKAIEIFQVNTAQVLRALDFARAAGVKTFIYASSGGVYGFPETGVAEDVAIPASGNLGFYLSSKLCAEILAENYAQFMNVVMLRFFFVYGVGQKRSMLIPRLVDNIREGKPITLQGRDGIKINPVHVSDAVRAIHSTFGLQGCHRINVAGPDILSLREICGIIGKKVGMSPNFEINSPASNGNLIGDITSMKKLLCYPMKSFGDGIDDLL